MTLISEDNSLGTIFLALGAIYIILGLAHKKEWKKNHKSNKWENLTKRERRFRLWTIVGLGLLVLLGFVFFFCCFSVRYNLEVSSIRTRPQEFLDLVFEFIDYIFVE